MKPLLDISVDELQSHQIVAWGYTEELNAISFKNYENWVKSGFHGDLKYLSDHRKDLRSSLAHFFPDANSAISFLFDYRNARKVKTSKYKVASYVTGFDDQDYHYWIQEKLELIADGIQKILPSLNYKISLDIHPVLERDLAYRAGLGWFGKNSMLINRKVGSFNLIGSIVLDKKLPIEFHQMETDHCGNCTACIDACPTNAILTTERQIDASKCISHFTIETFKDYVPPSGYPTVSQEVFGCDICQDVCPWNKKSMNRVEEIQNKSVLDRFFDRGINDIYNDINELSNNQFKQKFKNTSFERLGKRGLLKNLKYYLK